MGEQLICKLNPMADVVEKQLGQLGDQWQSLNQAAASQTRSLDGAKSLQDFDKKVEQLEAWIKDKVEKSLVFYVTEIRCDFFCGKKLIFDGQSVEQGEISPLDFNFLSFRIHSYFTPQELTLVFTHFHLACFHLSLQL